MFEIRPFKGLRFNPAISGNPDDLVTPPFDVISPAQRRELAARSPYNAVHVILPEDEGDRDRYSLAAERYRNWQAEGVLSCDSEEHYYALEQRFRDMDGQERVRRVLYGLAKIPETGENLVLGHERTFRHKIEDRLSLLRACHVQPGGVFVLYNDVEDRMKGILDESMQGTPYLETNTIDGVHQRMWAVEPSPAVQEFFADKHVYIGDGHHRFATAQTFRDESRAAGTAGEGHEYIMLGFVAFEDPGLLVYPAHRLVASADTPSFEELTQKVREFFDVIPVEGDLLDTFQSSGDGVVFGLAMTSGQQCLLRMKDVERAAFLGDDHGPSWRDLDVSVLHRGILERLLGLEEGAELQYEPDPQAALSRCASGECGMAWLMNPATPAQIQACADAGEFMPQKATYLFPKLPTGGVMYGLES